MKIRQLRRKKDQRAVALLRTGTDVIRVVISLIFVSWSFMLAAVGLHGLRPAVKGLTCTQYINTISVLFASFCCKFIRSSGRCSVAWPNCHAKANHVAVYRPMLSISRESWQTAHGPQQAVTRQSLKIEPEMPPMVLTLVLMATKPPGTQWGIRQHSLSRVAMRHSMQGKQQ